ncbi:MAG: protein kinase [Desulfomonile tiedjei]|nr:protein kinase [Desulfomonile tiedjei]
MSDSAAFKDQIERMWQEAEVYESQGLYDQAISVCQNILNKEPHHRRAQAKIVQIQLTQRLHDPSVAPRSDSTEFSPQVAFDLGLAYMGMKLYAEAIEEFRKVLDPAFSSYRAEAMAYQTSCLLHLKKFNEALANLTEVLRDSSLDSRQKGEFIEEMVGACIEEGLMAHARDLLLKVPEELKRFISDYDVVVKEVSSAGPAKETEFAIFVEDTRTGAVYDTGTEMSAPPEPEPGAAPPFASYEAAIPVTAHVAYSRDNKNWREGRVSQIAAGWAQLHMTEDARVGDTLVLKIHLPGAASGEPVWIISRIAESGPSDQKAFQTSARAEFTSFLPGGETLLKAFIDAVVKDPSITAEQPVPRTTRRRKREQLNGELFSTLQTEAVRALETQFLEEAHRPATAEELQEAASTTERLAKAVRGAIKPTRTGPRVRFACQCGQVHDIPAHHVGRQGTCTGCDRTITVPQVDARPDSLAEQMIGQMVGGCRLLHRIGGGGMGGVFKGHHAALDIPVAVKVLHAHLAEKDPIFIRRFIREARAAAKLQHPNIVTVMNVGIEKGVHFLVMPYVTGGSAALLLAKIGKLPLAKVLQIGLEIARALTVAEEHKMLHRDIKPANILFNSRGEALLADLGLAKQYVDAQETGITQTGITCGTPLYFSPEQAKGFQNLDIRSDIYSLGITLYHLLAGTPPFTGESAYVIFQKHVHDPLPPFKDTDIPLGEAVFTVLNRMTCKKPEERYQNSQEVLAALEELRKDLADYSKASQVPPPRNKGLLERLGIRKSG